MGSLFTSLMILNIVLTAWGDRKRYPKLLRLTITVLAVLVITFDFVLNYLSESGEIPTIFYALNNIFRVSFMLLTIIVIRVSWKQRTKRS